MSKLVEMQISDENAVRNASLIVVGLIIVKLVAVPFLPPSIDEAYYWTWSKGLAWGYYDHPPLVAAVIWLGTKIFGDDVFGIRIVPILLTIPMSWAVYRAASIFFSSRKVGATAAVMLNVTMMVLIGVVIVTPDAPLMLFSSFVFFFLAKVWQTGDGRWWIGVGASIGLALLSKYTAFFFGPVILLWLLAIPRLRIWFRSPWPYLGAVVAGLIFLPVIVWNSHHEWVSFLKQFGRIKGDQFRPFHVLQLVLDQFGFATPAVFILAATGYVAIFKGVHREHSAGSGLIVLTLVVFFVYFGIHSLHDNVHPQWLSPIYPTLATAAAIGVEMYRWPPFWQKCVDWLRMASVPGSVILFGLLIFQSHTGLLNGNRRDETVGQLAIGFEEVARRINALKAELSANCILVDGYGTAAWLKWYLPNVCVEQRAERIRWESMPPPPPENLKGRQLFVTEGDFDLARLSGTFPIVEKVAALPRKRRDLVARTYDIYLLDGAAGSSLDFVKPQELLR